MADVQTTNQSILVVGGGISGITAALEAAETGYDVTVKTAPRYVNEKCTCCGKCAEACETEIDNPFNFGMDKIKAAYLPQDFAFPMRYVLDPSIAGTDEGKKCQDSCDYDAIDLDMQEATFDLKAGAIVWATG